MERRVDALRELDAGRYPDAVRYAQLETARVAVGGPPGAREQTSDHYSVHRHLKLGRDVIHPGNGRALSPTNSVPVCQRLRRELGRVPGPERMRQAAESDGARAKPAHLPSVAPQGIAPRVLSRRFRVDDHSSHPVPRLGAGLVTLPRTTRRPVCRVRGLQTARPRVVAVGTCERASWGQTQNRPTWLRER